MMWFVMCSKVLFLYIEKIQNENVQNKQKNKNLPYHDFIAKPVLYGGPPTLFALKLSTIFI